MLPGRHETRALSDHRAALTALGSAVERARSAAAVADGRGRNLRRRRTRALGGRSTSASALRASAAG